MSFALHYEGVEPWPNIHNAFVFVIELLNPRNQDKTIYNRLTSIQKFIVENDYFQYDYQIPEAIFCFNVIEND